MAAFLQMIFVAFATVVTFINTLQKHLRTLSNFLDLLCAVYEYLRARWSEPGTPAGAS